MPAAQIRSAYSRREDESAAAIKTVSRRLDVLACQISLFIGELKKCHVPGSETQKIWSFASDWLREIKYLDFLVKKLTSGQE